MELTTLPWFTSTENEVTMLAFLGYQIIEASQSITFLENLNITAIEK